MSNTEQLTAAGIDVPPETDTDFLKKLERDTVPKATLVEWYQHRIDQARGMSFTFGSILPLTQ
jgi:hypothetical protein